MKFSKDYSKLQKDEFSTIRANTGFYSVGKFVKVKAPSKEFSARIEIIGPIRRADITEEFAQSDADCSREELLQMFDNWYGAGYDDLIFIWLKKIKK